MTTRKFCRAAFWAVPVCFASSILMMILRVGPSVMEVKIGGHNGRAKNTRVSRRNVHSVDYQRHSPYDLSRVFWR